MKIITSGLCSMTITEWPRSTSELRASSNRSMSNGCKPAVGSSRMKIVCETFLRPVERCGRAAQKTRKLKALGLAAGERRCRLAQAKVVQANVQQGTEPGLDPGPVAEEAKRLARRQIENLGDAPSPVGDFQDLGAIAPAPAVRTRIITSDRKCMSTVRKPSPLQVPHRPPSRLKLKMSSRSCGAGLMGGREGPADLVERLQVRDRVRSSRPADGSLIKKRRVRDIADAGQLAERLHRHWLVMQPLPEQGKGFARPACSCPRHLHR